MYDSKGQHIEPNQVNDPSLDFFLLLWEYLCHLNIFFFMVENI